MLNIPFNLQDTFEKYVVAASVTESQRKSEMTIHETSLMPSIPGFGPLMAMLFSPYCEFFRDTYKSRYVAILCGLGGHPLLKRPIYGEHDAVLNLDVEIDVIDIETVEFNKFYEFVSDLMIFSYCRSTEFGSLWTLSCN